MYWLMVPEESGRWTVDWFYTRSKFNVRLEVGAYVGRQVRTVIFVQVNAHQVAVLGIQVCGVIGVWKALINVYC